MPVKKWRRIMRGVNAAHNAIVRISYIYLPSIKILKEIGHEKFISQWPVVRELFNPDKAEEYNRLILFDAVWSVLVTGDSQYPVNAKISMLSKGRQAIIKATVETPGISIYQLAKAVNRDYSRVYKEVMLLKEKQILEVKKKEKAPGRAVSQVFARDSINTELAKASVDSPRRSKGP